ncbi:fungal-specific transcription factor domain-containing protein [Aspergillus cavernicola]|uniref:Fungal-specific transcription factor domain-containing protein n=1 Tax=Aspergillus cavernicola TaxID=176166 RepID=A0ABR4H7R5_9EURO
MPRQSTVSQEELPRSKRPRAAQACDRCRSKKYKCDERYPCSHCKKSRLDCVYQRNYRQLENDRSVSYVLDLEKKVEELSSKLLQAELKLSPSHCELNQAHPSLNATPCSMPAADRPTSTPKQDLEELSYDAPVDEPDEAGDSGEGEITELNHHTNGIEFHGSTSSVAFLGHLQKARDPQRTEEQWPSRPLAPEYSIVSTLHNAGFSPNTSAAQSLAAVYEQNYYFEHAHVFMSGYFQNIHFIHPLIDKEDFYLRAQDLWLRRTPTPDPSFVALYLSVLSFGALLRVWDEVQLGGLTRFEWSRKLFGEAQLYLNHLHFPNNLDAVQCLYLMAKICQNELNPNLAYMYLGLSIRTCLAAGFNRKVHQSSEPRAEWISKTWWGLFSLEIEMSFSLGRPDTLGMDEYHNRPLPPRDSSQYAIIPWMVDFARITRKVSVQIYHRRLTLSEKLTVALAIEAELDTWMAQLPDHIRPDFVSPVVARNALRDPKWARRQRVVLGIRYYNVKMLLFRPFLGHFTSFQTHHHHHHQHARQTEIEPKPDPDPESIDLQCKLTETITKCLDAAEKTISVIQDIYRLHTFFRCWWYNTTYVTFATSTLLLSLSKSKSIPTLNPDIDQLHLRQSVEKAIDILEATDECVVARKCVEIIRFYLKEFEHRGRERDRDRDTNRTRETQALHDARTSSAHATGADWVFSSGSGFGFEFAGSEDGGGFDVPEWAYGFGFPDYSFEGIAQFFDELGDCDSV